MGIRNSLNELVSLPITITPSSGVATLDCSLGNHFTISISLNCVLNATNIKASQVQKITLEVVTSGTTPCGLILGTGFKGNGVIMTGKTTSVYYLLEFKSNGTSIVESARSSNVPTTPAQIAGNLICLEADAYLASTSDGATLTAAWPDRSPTYRSPTVVGAPTYKVSGINSRPAVRLVQSTSSAYAFSTFAAMVSGHFYFVWNLTAVPPSYGGCWFGQETGGLSSHYYYPDDGLIYDTFGTNTRKGGYSTITTPLSTTAHIFHGYSRPSAYRIFQNNTALVAEVTSNTVAFTTTPFLGKNQGAYFMTVEISAFYMYDDKLSPENDKFVLDYIKGKYNL